MNLFFPDIGLGNIVKVNNNKNNNKKLKNFSYVNQTTSVAFHSFKLLIIVFRCFPKNFRINWLKFSNKNKLS